MRVVMLLDQRDNQKSFLICFFQLMANFAAHLSVIDHYFAGVTDYLTGFVELVNLYCALVAVR